MPDSTPDVVGLFQECIPQKFLRDSLHCLFGVYATVFDDVKKSFPPWEAHDLRPHYRKAQFDSEWREVAKRHGLAATPEPNWGRNCFHTRVVAGRVILTASAVRTPDEIVRYAAFRDSYARSNIRYFPILEEDMGLPPPAPDDPLYAILIHGAARGQKAPYFADIVFPAAEVKTYVARLPLFALFPDLVNAQAASIQEERIEDLIEPELREDLPRPEEERQAEDGA